MLLLIVGFQLQAVQLLYAQDGSVYGAGYTDLKVTLPMYYLASAACVLAAVTLLVGMKRKSLKLAAIGPAVLVLVLVLGNIAAIGVQSFDGEARRNCQGAALHCL